MRRFLALALVVCVVGLGVPTAVFAGQQQVQSVNGTVSGTAKHTTGQPVGNHAIRLRNAGNNTVVGKGTTSGTGAFTFNNVPPGTYVVELLDDAGQVIATSTGVTLAGQSLTVSGVAVTLPDAAAAAAAGSAAAGGSFFASTPGILLLVAAGAATVAIVATKGESSPSK